MEFATEVLMLPVLDRLPRLFENGLWWRVI